MKYVARTSVPAALSEHTQRADRGQVARIAFSAMTSLIALVALPFPFVAFWLAAVIVWDLQAGAYLIDRIALHPKLTPAQQVNRLSIISG
ncbi:MAG: hypothetical protein ACOYJ6_15750 [Caulobacterales bacterium]|jgi:hypothetical protein